MYTCTYICTSRAGKLVWKMKHTYRQSRKGPVQRKSTNAWGKLLESETGDDCVSKTLGLVLNEN